MESGVARGLAAEPQFADPGTEPQESLLGTPETGEQLAPSPSPAPDLFDDLAPPPCRCGAGPNPNNPERCALGHLLRGNAAAVNTGSKSLAFWRAHDEELRETVRAIVEDRGFTVADAPRALVEAATGLAQAMLIRDSAFSRVAEEGGPLAHSGKGRRAFNVWATALDRAERHLKLIGLGREPRRAVSVAEYVAAAAARTRAERGEGDDAGS